MKIAVSDKETGQFYATFDLPTLINALSDPLDFVHSELAVLLRYEMSGDNLLFKIVEDKPFEEVESDIILPKIETEKNKILSQAMTWISEDAKESEEVKKIFDGLASLMDKEVESDSINWEKLREKYFEECVDRTVLEHNGTHKKYGVTINLAPHDLFEWFKQHLNEIDK